MTSVLYSAGLNYQVGNPVRSEINKLTNGIDELRKLIDGQNAEITKLREQVAKLEAAHAPGGSHPPVPGVGGLNGGGGGSS